MKTSRWRHGSAIATVLGTLVMGVSGANAQQSVDVRTDEARQLSDDFDRLRDATERANLLLRTDDGGDITYADILANPDDIVLNFRWAKAQLARGEVRGASATLERILVLDPDLAPVRLYYAIVLYRLDSLDEARAQFDRLRHMDISPEVAASIDSYVDAIERRRQRLRQALTVTLGSQVDSNRNSAPNDKQQLVTGTLTNITASGDKPQNDIAYIGALRYDISYDLGYQEGHEVFASVTGYGSDQVRLDSLDLGSFSVDVGTRLRGGYWMLTPSVNQTVQSLSKEKYLTSRSGRLRLDWNPRPFFNLNGEVSYADERFQNTSESSALRLHSGQRYGSRLGTNYSWTPNNRTSFNLSAGKKEAARNYYSYDSLSGELIHAYLFGGGSYISGSFRYGIDRYRDPDYLVTGNSPRHRMDRSARTRLTYGAPLSQILPSDLFGDSNTANQIYDLLAPINWSITGEYLNTKSNIPNYEYHNARAQIYLTRRWEF
ncbi:tetratricopeptide repeat protein [Thalassospira sp. GO-4]|uniref:tetratricopeptide repeat protein n=1 Tax=Thalassospira TaxID=168934 RepID=UPI002023D9E1|nr:tetratricopeptide repeat protein [Thalassospira sp. GO-4]URK19722.1 tetratricopeptide repeat protein [Thalassospira sp. GO-4]